MKKRCGLLCLRYTLQSLISRACITPKSHKNKNVYSAEPPCHPSTEGRDVHVPLTNSTTTSTCKDDNKWCTCEVCAINKSA